MLSSALFFLKDLWGNRRGRILIGLVIGLMVLVAVRSFWMDRGREEALSEVAADTRELIERGREAHGEVANYDWLSERAERLREGAYFTGFACIGSGRDLRAGSGSAERGRAGASGALGCVVARDDSAPQSGRSRFVSESVPGGADASAGSGSSMSSSYFTTIIAWVIALCFLFMAAAAVAADLLTLLGITDYLREKYYVRTRALQAAAARSTGGNINQSSAHRGRGGITGLFRKNRQNTAAIAKKLGRKSGLATTTRAPLQNAAQMGAIQNSRRVGDIVTGRGRDHEGDFQFRYQPGFLSRAFGALQWGVIMILVFAVFMLIGPQVERSVAPCAWGDEITWSNGGDYINVESMIVGKSALCDLSLESTPYNGLSAIADLENLEIVFSGERGSRPGGQFEILNTSIKRPRGPYPQTIEIWVNHRWWPLWRSQSLLFSFEYSP